MTTSETTSPPAKVRRSATGSTVLSVSDLNVTFPSEGGEVNAVRGLSFDLTAGRTMAIVGESGSGKSVTSLAIMGLHPPTARISGSVKLHGDELIGRGDEEMSRIRGNEIAMIFQDPLSALTPVYTVGDQIIEAIRTHHPETSPHQARSRAIELLDLVGIAKPDQRIRSFPHEFSGGMRQRAMIAMAIANDPDVIIADEPTTALDVTIQAQVLEVLRKAQQETGAALILITHDLGVVAGIADEVTVMYAGRPVEQGPVDDIYYRPAMPYTIGLLGAVPRIDQESKRLATIEGNPPLLVNLPPGCPFTPRCPIATDQCATVEPDLAPVGPGHTAACHSSDRFSAADADRKIFPIGLEGDHPPRVEQDLVVVQLDQLKKHHPLMKGAIFRRRVGTVYAVDGIDLEIRAGETVGLVGESGCGKSTTIMEILNFTKPTDGTITVLGKDTARLSRRDRISLRRDIQVVFQDPMASLDPRLPVFDIIAEPLGAHGVTKVQQEARVAELMQLVGLDPSFGSRYPRQFSGGQRQRIGIARALALEPKILVLDEPVSALDVSIQAGVINLLERLKLNLGLSYLFVAHDLAVVQHIADRIAVMYAGRIVETGDTKTIFTSPTHPYTQALISAIPIPDPNLERKRQRILLRGELPSPASPPSGCRFRTRCQRLLTLNDSDKQLCFSTEPNLVQLSGNHESACHFNDVARAIGSAPVAKPLSG